MKHCQKINQTIVGHLFPWMNKLLLIGGIIFGFNGVSMAENTMSEIYVINLSSNKALCGVKINNMFIMNNLKSIGGNYSSGQNISSILKNGINTIGLSMYNSPLSEEENKLTSDMWCNVELNKLSENGNSMLVSRIKLTGDENGKLVVADKDQKNGDQIYFGIPDRKNEHDSLEAINEFSVHNLPDWKWTTATPVTEADIPKVKSFYLELQEAFANKDLKKLKEMGQISWEELAYADNSSPDVFWESLDFKDKLDKGYSPSPIDWNEYIFSTYEGNRIFRYEIGLTRLSPIELINREGKAFQYNPYLSIINGKVTIVR